MKLSIKENNLEQVDAHIKFVYEDNIKDDESLKVWVDKEAFGGKDEQIFYFTNSDASFTILVGLGKFEDLTKEKFTNAVAKSIKQINKLKAKTYVLNFIQAKQMCAGEVVTAFAEGVVLANYTFNKYKSQKDEHTSEGFIDGYPQEKKDKILEKLEHAINIAHSINFARNLVNEPPCEMYPEVLADIAVKEGQECGFEVEVFDEHKIQEMKMGAFWAVGKGSDRLPRFIIMRYNGDPENETCMGLVGKGLTIDTGGYSIKHATGMEAMKNDMSGSATVVGVMRAFALNKVKANVVAVVAACENTISGGSYKPGDLVTAMNGKTIEVINTDAEGRLTLADAITYITENEKVDKVVDIATLTGSVLAALGTNITGVISNNTEFYNDLEKAGKRTGEKFWRLPNDDSFKAQIKGDFADIKNSGGPYGGSITAGMFLQEFVGDTPWLHLDIAGTAWSKSNTDICPKGGTGVGVRTLYHLVVNNK
ncbi:MAG: leucyl aminopeptidase [Epulopiscium sp. Nele67-Bin005]|nr:MAG: leucyl aminopeptidase [Epulopiscium sp. Nele67-Bin005]